MAKNVGSLSDTVWTAASAVTAGSISFGILARRALIRITAVAGEVVPCRTIDAGQPKAMLKVRKSFVAGLLVCMGYHCRSPRVTAHATPTQVQQSLATTKNE